jgi:MYXO-CTERM domain-containing protein
MKNKVLAALLLAAGVSANAAVITLDDFSEDQGPVTDTTTSGGDERNEITLGNGIDREIRVDLDTAIAPPQATAQVTAGILDVTNGTGDDSDVEIRWDSIPGGLVPTGATNVNFFFGVVASDANPTSVTFSLGGVNLGTFSIGPNTFSQTIPFAIDAALLNAGGELELEINGQPGWDLALDSFGVSFDEPAAAPLPGTLALLGLGLLGLARRKV